MSGNDVTLIGNLARDPELRFTSGGQALVEFGLAVNRRWQNPSTKEWEEEVSFFDVTCWRELAEHVAESLSKGSRVMVAGRLEQQSWESSDGEKRSKVKVTADDVGPSLRYAIARVEKIAKSGNGGPPPREMPAGYGYSEEPF